MFKLLAETTTKGYSFQMEILDELKAGNDYLATRLQQKIEAYGQDID